MTTNGQTVTEPTSKINLEDYIKDTERDVENRSCLDEDIDVLELNCELFYQEVTHKKRHLLLDS